MKYAIVIPDGAADFPLEQLGGRTPLQAADKPVIDSLAEMGRVGMVRNVPEGYPPGSDVAILSLVGYDVTACYTGRAPLEAAAQGLTVADDEWVFRCNLVTLGDGKMVDYCSGHITTDEAAPLIESLNEQIAGHGVRFHVGVGYRHLMITRGKFEVELTPPHDITGQPYGPHLPTGDGSDRLRELMTASQAVLAERPAGAARRKAGKNPATSIWLWGHGKMPQLQSFAERFGKSAAVITAVDLVRGIATLTGIDRIDVPGATGYIDTNYVGKGQAAVAALDEHDLVIVHVEAPDECGHNGQVAEKTQSIGDIDTHVVAPLLKRLQAEPGGWRMCVLPDHPTPCAIKTHTPDPVPFVLAGSDVEPNGQTTYDETTAAATGLLAGPGELMDLLLT
ncbi:MAG: cofactor-independent phosphoglycerate mutase [Planctomycetota bacterium]|jgi:2,3-bisphosphoglycerate-independent phosphoglycerate mutase